MIILQGITVDELNKQIETIVEKKLYEVIEQVRPPKDIKYLTRVQVSEPLKISLPTLNEWTKLGLVKSCKIRDESIILIK